MIDRRKRTNQRVSKESGGGGLWYELRARGGGWPWNEPAQELLLRSSCATRRSTGESSTSSTLITPSSTSTPAAASIDLRRPPLARLSSLPSAPLFQCPSPALSLQPARRRRQASAAKASTRGKGGGWQGRGLPAACSYKAWRHRWARGVEEDEERGGNPLTARRTGPGWRGR